MPHRAIPCLLLVFVCLYTFTKLHLFSLRSQITTSTHASFFSVWFYPYNALEVTAGLGVVLSR